MQNFFPKALAACALAAALGLPALSAQAEDLDPPSEVGRIARVEGRVHFRGSDGANDGPALLNWPLTSRNTISTERNGRAELRVGSTVLRLDNDTMLELSQLDDNRLQLRLLSGTISAHIRNPDRAREFELGTPQGTLTLSGTAQIRVSTNLKPGATLVSVTSGSALFHGDGNSMTVRAGRRLEFSYDNVLVGAASRDDFDRWNDEQDRNAVASVSLQYVSPETTGYEELDRNGTWIGSADHGPLWVPTTVAADWAPYRYGRWTWLQPWGWTWVDDAPWAYAPSHYGRWVWHKRRWAWSPGAMVTRPVWAPALVAWVGGGKLSATFSIGGHHHHRPATGWFPLAPKEVYVPSYRVSHGYHKRVNITHVTNITRITEVVQTPSRQDYRNRLAAATTMVPREHFNVGPVVNVRNAPRMLQGPREIDPAWLHGPSQKHGERRQDGGRQHHGGDHRANPPQWQGAQQAQGSAHWQGAQQPQQTHGSQQTQGSQQTHGGHQPQGAQQLPGSQATQGLQQLPAAPQMQPMQQLHSGRTQPFQPLQGQQSQQTQNVQQQQQQQQQQADAERQRAMEVERQRQAQANAERQRQADSERERQRQADNERQRVMEQERQRQLQANTERNRAAEAERQRFTDAERQRVRPVEGPRMHPMAPVAQQHPQVQQHPQAQPPQAQQQQPTARQDQGQAQSESAQARDARMARENRRQAEQEDKEERRNRGERTQQR